MAAFPGYNNIDCTYANTTPSAYIYNITITATNVCGVTLRYPE